MPTISASDFSQLHCQPAMLVLPNAWDVASALLQQQCGAQAVGTSSAALSWSMGYRDASAMPRSELVTAVQRMARALSVPLTVDVEDGYSADPDLVADLAVAIHNVGAAGINLEDGAGSSELLARKIAAIRARLAADDLFINARTDVYLRSLATDEAALSMVLNRANQYKKVGANGIFVPGLVSLSDARQVAWETNLPLNLMALPGMPSVEELRSSGVKRLSAGPALFLSAYRDLRDQTAALLSGRVSAMFERALEYPHMESLVASAR